MTEQQKKSPNRVQNIIIVVLAVSAVLLLAQTQLYTLGNSLPFGPFSGLRGGSTGVSAVAGVPVSLTDVPVPVQIAVSSKYGRYGQTGLTTTDGVFSPLGTLLGEALGSAGGLLPSDAAGFQAGLDGVCVYYDFFEPLPLELLAGLTGTSLSGGGQSARAVLLSIRDGGVALDVWDGNDGFFRCTTYVTPETLTELTANYPLGNAAFAFEMGDEYDGLAPLTLFISAADSVPVLAVSAGPSDPDALMTLMRFNSHTNKRYNEPSGTEVIVENDRTLYISTDGSVTYQGGGSDALRVESSGETPTLSESVLGGYRLLRTLLGDSLGEAALCLQDIRQNGSAVTLRFSLLVNGLPVCFADGSPAATMTLSGTQVSSFTLRIRQYTSTAEPCLLLPLRQAAAIARQHSGTSLTACYVDGGSAAVSAQWLAD